MGKFCAPNGRDNLRRFLYILLTIMVYGLSSKLYSNQRNCYLFPVQVKTEGDTQVFEEVESYLRRSDWCVYVNPTAVYDILSSVNSEKIIFAKNLELRSLISKKLGASSLVSIQDEEESYKLVVYGKNGLVNYNSSISKNKISSYADLIKFSIEELETYSKTIPYVGIVVGKSEQVVSISAGSEFGIKKGDILEFVGDIEEKRHPLYGFIIDYRFSKICSGRVVQTNFGMSLVELEDIQNNNGCNLIKLGTAVKKTILFENMNQKIDTLVSNKKGKKLKSRLRIKSLAYSSLDSLVITEGTNEYNFSGFNAGVGADSFFEITRNYGANIRVFISKSFMSLDTNDNVSQEPIGFDYRYGLYLKKEIPKLKDALFFASLGYASSEKELTNDSTRFASAFSVSGLYLDLKLKVSINPTIDAEASLFTMVSPSGEQDQSYLGVIKGSSMNGFYGGIVYKKLSSFNFQLGINVDSSVIEYQNVSNKLTHNSLGLIAGINLSI